MSEFVFLGPLLFFHLLDAAELALCEAVCLHWRKAAPNYWKILFQKKFSFGFQSPHLSWKANFGKNAVATKNLLKGKYATTTWRMGSKYITSQQHILLAIRDYTKDELELSHVIKKQRMQKYLYGKQPELYPLKYFEISATGRPTLKQFPEHKDEYNDSKNLLKFFCGDYFFINISKDWQVKTLEVWRLYSNEQYFEMVNTLQFSHLEILVPNKKPDTGWLIVMKSNHICVWDVATATRIYEFYTFANPPQHPEDVNFYGDTFAFQARETSYFYNVTNGQIIFQVLSTFSTPLSNDTMLMCRNRKAFTEKKAFVFYEKATCKLSFSGFFDKYEHELRTTHMDNRRLLIEGSPLSEMVCILDIDSQSITVQKGISGYSDRTLVKEIALFSPPNLHNYCYMDRKSQVVLLTPDSLYLASLHRADFSQLFAKFNASTKPGIPNIPPEPEKIYLPQVFFASDAHLFYIVSNSPQVEPIETRERITLLQKSHPCGDIELSRAQLSHKEIGRGPYGNYDFTLNKVEETVSQIPYYVRARKLRIENNLEMEPVLEVMEMETIVMKLLDRYRGRMSIIFKETRNEIPEPEDCTREEVDHIFSLCDVPTDVQ